jgi:hypothetical protein
VEDLDAHLKKESTRANWNRICTIDPLGMYSNPPSQSATDSVINMPELHHLLHVSVCVYVCVSE